MTTQNKRSPWVRGTFWASIGFYALVAFEFFYMVSPFAAYIYSVYGPGLEALKLTESTGWLIGFFMPHIARETTSLLITWHEAIGGVILTAGLLTFAIGVVQIYRSKLTNKQAVTGGLYRWIRHPQYIALMIASFGMLLLWPRYLVLFGFITVCFAYYMLARMEERICRREFPGYDEYTIRTGMFFPYSVEKYIHRLPFPDGRNVRILTGFALYVFCIFIAFAGARLVHENSINSLYVYETQTDVYLSVGRLDRDSIAALAVNNPDVGYALSPYQTEKNRFINYVMPVDLYISEVPMYIPEGVRTAHHSPGRKDQSRYKIIFTLAHFSGESTADGRDILRRAVNKSPLLEVWIDRPNQRILRVLNPPETEFYNGIPVPVF